MDWIFSASIIASFFAGMVALFAPCCVSVLLPTYLASVFRLKTKVMKMTFVYFAGMTAILLPIGLGAASLARFFQDFHKEMYIIGGLMMVIFGIMSFAGKGMAFLPKSLQPGPDGFSGKSVFFLGVFSGAATSCCAPVLAGAMTLAVLSGAFLKALIVVFAYIFGMTFPLFLLALFWDKYDISNSRLVRGKLFEFNLGERKFYIHSTNLFAGIIFLAIGAMLIWLAIAGNPFWAPQAQTALAKYLTDASVGIIKVAQKIPDFLWGIILVAFFIFAGRFAFINNKDKNKENNGQQ